MEVWARLLPLALVLCSLGCNGASSRFLRGRSLPEVLVFAHRGARSMAPENTLAAARLAWERGTDGWEFDVQMTADGELVLMHDSTLTRTTNARQVFPERSPWRVEDFTLEEIRRLDAGSWFLVEDPFGTLGSGDLSQEKAAQYRGEKVPTLREALLLSRELGLLANIELKSIALYLTPRDQAVVERTVAMVRELGMEGQVIVSSFNHEMIRHLKRIAPDIAGGLLVMSVPANPAAYLEGYGADALNPKVNSFDPQVARELREAGYGVYVWTVNEPADLSRLAREPGVTGIITDWPQRLWAILGRSKR